MILQDEEIDSAPVLQRKWIKDQMKKRQRDFCDSTVFSIFCGTWNVNDKTLHSKGTLNDWLLPKDQFIADIFAIGFQETVALSTINVVFDGSKSTDRAVYWQRKICETFVQNDLKYVLVDEKHLVGNLLCVYAKAELIPFIRGVRGATTPIGIMGVMGNKGAVVVRFRIHNTTVCVVCSHLSANRENTLGRNADVRNINEKTALYPSVSTSSSGMEANEVVSQKGDLKYLSTQWSNDTALPLLIEEHDVIFWLGDLNYRIQESVSTADVLETVKSGRYKALLSEDQLFIEMNNKKVFQGYVEGQIEFEPTYKYQPGTDLYEARSDKKLRAPAWCDRVLWKENSAEDSVRQMNYRRAELNISDHRPVCALFNVDTCITDSNKEKKVYQDLLNKVDKWENASAPKVAVENRVIDFGPLEVHEWKSNTMVVRNIGQVLSSWQFVPKFDEISVSMPWLSFNPTRGILAPGEEIEVTVTLCVTLTHVETVLSSMKPVNNAILLEDIAIIRVTGGSDFFCIFSGLLAMPLQRLNSASSINTGSGSVSGGDRTPPAESDAVSPTSICLPAPIQVGVMKEESGEEEAVSPTYRPVRKNSRDSTRFNAADVVALTARISDSAIEVPLSPSRTQRANTVIGISSSSGSNSAGAASAAAGAPKVPQSKSVEGADDKFNETGFLSI